MSIPPNQRAPIAAGKARTFAMPSAVDQVSAEAGKVAPPPRYPRRTCLSTRWCGSRNRDSLTHDRDGLACPFSTVSSGHMLVSGRPGVVADDETQGGGGAGIDRGPQLGKPAAPGVNSAQDVSGDVALEVAEGDSRSRPVEPLTALRAGREPGASALICGPMSPRGRTRRAVGDFGIPGE